jgi:transcription elongation factor/antiterminator RfaH
MIKNWYTLHSHPNKEDLLWKHLETQSIEVYYPQLKVVPVNPRCRKVRPYFPGYLFVHVDLDEMGVSRFLYLPHASGLVTFGGEPPVVPDTFIDTLTRRLAELQEQVKRQHTFAKGDRVVINTGPLAGFEAIFEAHLSGTERVHLLLKMLNGGLVPLEASVRDIIIPKL